MPDARSVTVTRYAKLTPDDIDEWEHLARAVYPPGDERLGSDLRWADLDKATDYYVTARDGGELRACAWVTKRKVSIDGRPALVAGIRGVLSHPELRRRGYGRAVMEAAHELMRSFDDCAVALLFSSVMAVPFYESLGWRRIEGPVTCEQPGGCIVYTETLPPSAPVMALALRDSAHLPRGPVDVAGLPW